MIEKIFAEDGSLAYEGETLYGKPYGFGTAYWPNGHIRQQGIYDIKGIVEGKLCYPDGSTRFEGKLKICHGYGPNYPVEGSLFNEQGELIYQGKFHLRFGGVGYPMVEEPKEFGPCGSAVSIPIPVYSWEDERQAYRDAGHEPPEHIHESRRQLGLVKAEEH